jgi:cardiolipin synthase
MRALRELRSWPNLISISRVLLAFAFLAFDSTEVRLIVLMVAMASDYLDGFVARTVGPATRVGAFIDASADRFFVLIAISVLLFEGSLTTTGYFVMLIRDIMTAIGFLTARAMPSLRGAVFQARMSGKIVTVFQLATLLAALLRPSAIDPLLAVVAATSLWAVIDYTLYLKRVRVRS